MLVLEFTIKCDNSPDVPFSQTGSHIYIYIYIYIYTINISDVISVITNFITSDTTNANDITSVITSDITGVITSVYIFFKLIMDTDIKPLY